MPDEKPYRVRVLSGLASGTERGPFSLDELVNFNKQYGDQLGGLLVRSIGIYQGGKRIFTAPQDGGIDKFIAKVKPIEPPAPTPAPAYDKPPEKPPESAPAYAKPPAPAYAKPPASADRSGAMRQVAAISVFFVGLILLSRVR